VNQDIKLIFTNIAFAYQDKKFIDIFCRFFIKDQGAQTKDFVFHGLVRPLWDRRFVAYITATNLRTP
jgi:hypothetical protein